MNLPPTATAPGFEEKPLTILFSQPCGYDGVGIGLDDDVAVRRIGAHLPGIKDALLLGAGHNGGPIFPGNGCGVVGASVVGDDELNVALIVLVSQGLKAVG